LAIAIVIRTFAVQAFKIPSGSMLPTLRPGDLILVNKLVYGAKVPFTDYRLPALGKLKRGDPVVFIYPENPTKDFIKRLAGLEGDSVEIKEGVIYVNDKPAGGGVFGKIYYYNRGDYAKEGEKIVVPPGNIYVLGDNSASSQDSRYWGFVPKKNVIGKAMFIYWPLNRIRVIK
jgi:signal peptidase I